MKKITRKTIFYQCEICKTEYLKEKEARECESMDIERKIFKIGDKVRSLELRNCWQDKKYRVYGTIKKIIGPMAPDEEYMRKRLSGPYKVHVFQYEIAYTCPICHKQKTIRYYGREIVPSKK